MQRRLRTVLCCILAAILLCASPAQAFSDTKGHWAQEDIDRAKRLGLFSACTGDWFAPDSALTRAVFVSALADLDGGELPKASTSFRDVSADSTYARAIQWAVTNGITAGTGNNTFSPEQAVTREQLAVMLVRYANYKETALPRVRSRDVQFSDMNDCSDTGLVALYTLYRAGILDMEDEKICPKDTVTRAEYAEILCRCYNMFESSCTNRQQAMVISHMGYSVQAPENSLEAYEISDEKGYTYVEADVRFTKDDIAVLLHDAKIDRISNGSGKVTAMTYDQLLAFSFDAGKSDYQGTELATFQEFIELCAERYLHPYIELKSTVSARQIAKMFSIVSRYGMKSHVTWISFDYTNLKRIARMYPTAEIGYVHSYADTEAVQKAAALKNGKNSVYLCAKHTALTDYIRAECLRNGIYLEVWTIDQRETAIRQLNSSIQGITVDRLTVEDIYG